MTKFRGRLLELYIRFYTLADDAEMIDPDELLTERHLAEYVNQIAEQLRIWSLDQNHYDVLHLWPQLPEHPTDHLTTIDELEWKIRTHCTKSDFKMLARMIAKLRIPRHIRMFAINDDSDRQVSVDINHYPLRDSDFTDDYQ